MATLLAIVIGKWAIIFGKELTARRARSRGHRERVFVISTDPVIRWWQKVRIPMLGPAT